MTSGSRLRRSVTADGDDEGMAVDVDRLCRTAGE
jgi:hypothetical protein